MFILFALLPLAVNAACSTASLADCPKCGVGVIGVQYDFRTPCNCNDKFGNFGKLCPKTGDPHYPVCCSVDGKAATTATCKCGEKICNTGQLCTGKDNKCVYPTCSNTDGSKRLPSTEERCQCGDASCGGGFECTAKDNKCARPACSTVDGSAAATNTKGGGCQCGADTCTLEGDTCTASKSECKPKTAPPKPKTPETCKSDVVVTEFCTCGKTFASVGQTCPSKGDYKDTPQWPDCAAGKIFSTLNQACKCSKYHNCQYGTKCTQSGDYKGMCECVPGKGIGCIEKVPAQEKCPVACDGHTTMDANPIILNQCIKLSTQLSQEIYYFNEVKGNSGQRSYYTDSKCKTKLDLAAKGITAPKAQERGCNPGGLYINIPAEASSSTALKVTMPALFLVGLLAFVLL